jgi:hypothetical protein
MHVPNCLCDRRLLAALALLMALGSSHAASPRDELLRFVPDDVGFCLVLQDMRNHATALAESPFVEHLRKSTVGQSVRAAKEWHKLDAVESTLKKDLGVDWTRLRDDFLGDSVVFAFRPAPSGRKDQEQGIVLVRARNAEVLADIVDRINKLQKSKGELRAIEERDYKGVKYYCRQEARGTNFYCLRGAILIYSGEEAMVRQAIDQERLTRGEAPPPLARRLEAAGAGNAVIALWLNPRALDSEIESKTFEGKETTEEAARSTLVTCWKALDDVVFSVDLERDLSVSVALRGRPEQMPPGLRRFLTESARPSELWRTFPDNALLAVALRVDAGALFDAISDFIPKESRQSFRKDIDRTLGAALSIDFFKEVLPGIGPDGGVCVTAPPPGGKDWFPRVVLALRVSPGGGPGSVADALLKALDFGAIAAVLAYNSENREGGLRVGVDTVDKREVKYLFSEGGLPGGLQPAFGLRGGYLVLASSLDVLRAFRPAEGPGGPAVGRSPLLRISFKDWRNYLRERREELAGAISQKEGIGKDEARSRLDSLADGLQFLDRLEVSQRTAPGLAVFTLSVQTAQPLRK